MYAIDIALIAVFVIFGGSALILIYDRKKHKK